MFYASRSLSSAWGACQQMGGAVPASPEKHGKVRFMDFPCVLKYYFFLFN